MNSSIQEQLRELGADLSSFDDGASGVLLLGDGRTLRSFSEVQAIRFLTSWQVSGVATKPSTYGGTERWPFTIAFDEEAGMMTFNLSGFNYPSRIVGGAITATNSAPTGELFFQLREAIAAVERPSAIIRAGTFLYIKDSA